MDAADRDESIICNTVTSSLYDEPGSDHLARTRGDILRATVAQGLMDSTALLLTGGS